MKNTYNYAKGLLTALVMLAMLNSNAQQTPLLSTYTFNKLLVNPAFTGIDNEYRIFGLYRSQWGGMTSAPSTGGGIYDASLWKDRMGVGLYILNDQAGIFNQTSIGFSYAYKIKFAKEHQIAVGLSGTVLINRINFDAVRAKDVNDPGLADRRSYRTVFDLGAGVSYKWRSLIIGFAVPTVLSPTAKFDAGNGNKTTFNYARTYTGFAQYRIGIIKDKFGITPTVLVRKNGTSKYQADATLLLDYNKMVFGGGGYRTGYGLIGMLGINIMKMFTVAYAYEYMTQGALNGRAGATHEVTFGFHMPTTRHKGKDAQPTDLISKTDTVYIYTNNTTDSLAAGLSVATQSIKNMDNEVSALSVKNAALNERLDSMSALLEQASAIRKITEVKGTSANSFTLDKIYFDFKKYELPADSKTQLNSLADLLKQYNTMQIRIEGYSDNIGNNDANQQLSELRAKAVADYLASQGVAAGRLSYKGLGNTNPVGDNNTEAGRKQNRRVEFVIVNK